jgi:hypothetical protein
LPVVKVLVRAALIVLSAWLASGCAVSGYSAGSLQRHLVSSGLSPAEARCVVGHMGPRFGVSRLGARARPEAAELKAERAILKTCGVTKAGH